MKSEPSRRRQILEEIEQLTRELDQRRRAPRPAPASVMQAYQLVLAHHYERLDDGREPHAQTPAGDPPEGDVDTPQGTPSRRA
jgi:uncharacterized membrane protein